jgi:hypothetical protein
MNTKIKTGVPQKTRIFLRVWEPDEDDPEGRTDYYAKVGRLEIEGWLYGDYGDAKETVKDTLKRALKAEDALPEDVAKAVNLVVGYLVAGVQAGLTVVAAAAGNDDKEAGGWNIKAEMFYNDEGGWVVEVKALYEKRLYGAIVKKRVGLRHVTAEALRKVVERVVRVAYNARP